MTVKVEGSSFKKVIYHWNRILNVNEILERGAGKTPSRELACGMKYHFTLPFWILFWLRKLALACLRAKEIIKNLRKKYRATAAIERREYNWEVDSKRYTTYLSQNFKPRGSRNEFGMTARRESSTYKGQDSHWNTNFKLTYRSSQTDPITASNSALVVAGSIKEV